MSLFVRLSSSYFWYFAILGLVVPFLPIFLDGKGFSSLDIGETLAIITASRIVGPSLWAMLADKTGKQLSIIRFGALLAIISFCFLFWLNSFWSITWCLAIFSLFWTAILPQMEVMTLNSVRKSAKIYARIRLWGSIGFIVLAVTGGDIVERYSADAFTYLGFIVLLGLLISTLFLQQPRRQQTHHQNNSPISDKIFQLSFLLFFAAGLMLQMSFGPYYGFFALFLRDLNYPGIVVGLLIGLAVVAEIGIFIFAGQIFKRYTIKHLLIFSMTVTALRWWVLATFGDNFWLLSISQLIHAASFGLYHSASMQFIHQHFNSNQQSRGQALYIGGVYGLGGAIGAYVAGLLWQDGLGAQNAFYFAAITAFIGALLALFIPHRRESPVMK